MVGVYAFLMDEPTIFAHRGFWNSHVKQNSLEAFQCAAERNFGIETDIRTCQSRMVFSHDSPIPEALIEDIQLSNFHSRFALNIKEDGMQQNMQELIEWMLSTGSFVFDGSIPEMIKYKSLGIPTVLRMSEYEQELPWRSKIVWLDAFNHDWWIGGMRDGSAAGICEFIVVSPELHGRDPREVWDYIKKNSSKGDVKYSICTDRPVEFQMW